MPVVDGKIIGNPNDTYARPYTTIRGIGIPGPTGPQGTPGLIWQGLYLDATTYSLNDVVFYVGSSYVYINPVPSAGNAPTLVGGFWQLVVLGIDPSTLIQIVSALGNVTYTHVQSVASTVWNVNHVLDRNPSIFAVDSGGNHVECDITYIDVNNATLTFSSATTGEAYCN